MSLSKCVGWWQQTGFGRQPMERLLLEIDQGKISGSGTDIVAPFHLSGKFREDGAAEIIKSYEGKHSVFYVGQYDGEGTFHGTWDISGQRGEWLIRVVGPATGDLNGIQEIHPEP